jgi:hypothetical protein
VTPGIGLHVAVFACIAPFSGGCTRISSSDHADRIAAALWLPEDAVIRQDATHPVRIERGRSVYVDDSGAVTFQLRRACDQFAADVMMRFADSAWSRRDRQYLNPDLPTSVGPRCERHGGGLVARGGSGARVSERFIEWIGEWQNAEGDIVTYTFGGVGPQLHGYAAFIPKRVVASTLRRLGR